MSRNIFTRLSVAIAAVALAFGMTAAPAWGEDASDGGTDPLEPGIVEPVEEPAALISLDAASVQVADQTYTGSALTPAPTVTMNGAAVEPDYYDVTYAANVNVGTASVTVTGNGTYSGSAKATFKINPAAIASLKLSFSSSPYNGVAKSPTATVRGATGTLKAGVDYTLTVPKKRTAAGSYVYKAQGIGNYTGTKTATLKVKKTPLSKCALGKIAAKTFTGSAIKPSVSVRFQGKALKAGRDFKLTYSKNKSCGSAKVKVAGKGSVTGSKTLTFKIKPASVAHASIAKVRNKTYNGTAQTQAPTVKVNGKKLKLGRDYTLAYRSNVNAGTGYVIVKGQGNYKGRALKSFRIAQASIAGAAIDPIGQYEETGGAITPSPVVRMFGQTLVAGRDYTLSYEDNYYSGTATVEFTGRGNYRGSTYRTFTIVEPVLQTVYITKTGDCFHRDWCSSLRRSKIAVSRSDAIARGLRACHNCRP